VGIELRSIWTTVGGLGVHAVTSWPLDGRVVILVHGLGVSGLYMRPLAWELAQDDCKVFAPDLPGFGRSDKPRRVLNVPELADALAAWLGAVGMGRAVLVGNSMGCQIAVDCAVRYPALVDRLVLQGMTIDAAARDAYRQLGRLAVAALRETPDTWCVVGLDYLRCGLPRAMRTLYYALADRIEDKLPRVAVPTLVVHAERDPIAPRAWEERVANLLPHGRLVVLPGAGHIPNASAAGPYARLILPFLRGDATP
jgi:2-hydroxy-6-oxonona-2,4-dienedioate hydrolase